MVSVRLQTDTEHRDQVITTLWEHQTLGIIEDAENQLRAFFPDEHEARGLFPCAGVEVLELTTVDSAPVDTFDRQGWDPILVGRRFFVAPSWLDLPTPANRIRLVIASSTAFGTGRHESTQLVLEALEQTIQPGHAVVDVGCGSGILSMAASALGAARVVGCDIDGDAVRAARGQTSGVSFFLGACDAIQSGTADILVANISARVIDHLAYDINRITKPDGLIILSGFVAENRPRFFEPADSMRKGDWECWLCRAAQAYGNAKASNPQPFAQSWW